MSAGQENSDHGLQNEGAWDHDQEYDPIFDPCIGADGDLDYLIATDFELDFIPKVPVAEPPLRFVTYGEEDRPKADDSLPTDDVTRAQYVHQLLNAMKDVTECLDFAASNDPTFLQRWPAANTPLPAGTSRYWTDQQLEEVCRRVLAKAEILHCEGLSSLDIRNPTKLEYREAQSLSFAERIDHMCELMRRSKARCEKLIRDEGVDMFVAAPMHAMKTSMDHHAAFAKKRKL